MIKSIDGIFDSLYWLLGWRLFFFISLTFILLKLFSKLGTRAKSLDNVNRWNKNSKPTIGGLVFFSGYLMGFVPLLIHPSGKHLIVYFICGVLAFFLGLIDDIRRIKASCKLIGQLLIGILFVLGQHHFFSGAPRSEQHGVPFYLEILLTVIVIAGFMNSVNMLDNMDGIATIAAIPVMIIVLFFDCDELTIAFVMLLSMLGFLVFNWSPSKIFMGDSGSMLLGFIVAWLMLQSGKCGERQINEWNGFFRIILMMGSCAIFIVDSLVVVINRLRHGISPAQGGRDHTTHNMFYLGLSERQIAMFYLVLGSIQVTLVYFFIRENANTKEISWTIVSPILCYFFILFGFMLFISFRNLRLGKYEYKK